MFRTQVVEGIIIKTYRIEYIHKGVVLFTKNRGILYTIAHGAFKTKGKLRSLTDIFTRAQVFLYYNPVKKSYKITDMKQLEYYSHFRNSVLRFYAACLIVEIILKSFGGGETNQRLYKLCCDSFRLIDTKKEPVVFYIIIQFIFRFFNYTGFNLKYDICANCNTPIAENETVYYIIGESQFECNNCSGGDNIVVSPGITRYLKKTRDLTLQKAINIRVEKRDFLYLKRIFYHMIQAVLETELNTLKTGKDIL